MAERLAALAVAIFGFVLYACTSHPFPDWLDSPELIAAALRLGAFHPPGSPLAVILGHIFSLWPFSGPAASLLFFSGFFAAAGLYILARTVQDLWRNVGPPGRTLEGIVVILLAGGFALSPGLWSQAVRTEVYTLALFLFLCALREILHTACAGDDASPGSIHRLAAFCGMGLCVHPLVALTAMAGLIPLAFTRFGRRLFLAPRKMAGAALAFCLGAAPLVLLALMVRSPADLRWGDPTTLGGWIQFVTGQTFAHSFAQDQLGTGVLAALTAPALGAGLGLSVLALLGLYPLLRRKFLVAIVLLSTGLASTLTLALQRSVRLDNPDVFGYALPAVAVALLVGAGGLATIAGLLSRIRPGLSGLAAPLALLPALATVFFPAGQMDRSGCGSGRRLAAGALQGLEKNCLAVVADFNLAFMLDYLINVEGLRPDVLVLYLRDLDNRPLRARLARSRPDLEARLPTAEGLDRTSIGALAELRPVALDAGPHLGAGLFELLVPDGSVWLSVSGQMPPEDQLLCRARSFYTDLAPPVCTDGSADARTADVVAWHAYWQSRAARRLGLNDLSRVLADTAGAASPQDDTIRQWLGQLDPPRPHACEPPPRPPPFVSASKRPSVFTAFLLLFGLLTWALPLFLAGRFGPLRWPSWAVCLGGLVWMGCVLC